MSGENRIRDRTDGVQELHVIVEGGRSLPGKPVDEIHLRIVAVVRRRRITSASFRRSTFLPTALAAPRPGFRPRWK